MAANPNPSRITDPMWWLWEGALAIIPGVRLSGIYANKPGYHGTRAGNSSTNYSVRLTLDKQGPSDKAAGIDLTMSDAEMRKRTGYLRDAVARNDPRLAAVREFYGTLNSSAVYGRIKDSRTGTWRASSADSTHLWHIHISIFRAYVNIWAELEPILSVLSGESLARWNARKNGGRDLIGLKKGDSGQEVTALQGLLRNAGFPPEGGVDGDYGDKTSAAVLKMRKAMKSNAKDGDSFQGWAFAQLMTALAIAHAGKDGKDGIKGDTGPAPTAAQLGSAVAAWMASHGGTLRPSEAEIRAFVEGWAQQHKEELRGPAGKTPTEVTFTGIVTAVA